MADDKTKKGAADRRTVAAGEGYEVRYFAKKHGLTVESAQKLIDKVGPDRKKLNAAAEKLGSGTPAKIAKAAGGAVKSAVESGKSALRSATSAKKR